MARKSVLLDRDGVLNLSEVRNGKPYAPRRFADFSLYPGTDEQLIRLQAGGFLLVVVTNQPDIGNGLADSAEIERMHDFLRSTLPIAAVYMCPHSQTEGCACRKPRPGMLLAAAEQFDIDLSASFMVGDRAGDVSAGLAAGCRTIFIDRDYGEPKPLGSHRTVASLAEAVDEILNLDNELNE